MLTDTLEEMHTEPSLNSKSSLCSFDGLEMIDLI